jgi:hypothetical protein
MNGSDPYHVSRRSLLLLAAISAGGCATEENRTRQGRTQEGSAVIVEVDLYSGRPNPTFVVDAAAAAELRRRLDALPPASGTARPRDGLGYRGLRVRAGTPELPPEVYVSDGTVVVHAADGSATRLADEGRALERWLFEAGAAGLGPDEAAVVRDDLAGR